MTKLGIDLPEWNEIQYKLDKSQDNIDELSFLELFIYENEPHNDSEKWRTQLIDMITELEEGK